jgi:hypothetical protein
MRLALFRPSREGSATRCFNRHSRRCHHGLVVFVPGRVEQRSSVLIEETVHQSSFADPRYRPQPSPEAAAQNPPGSARSPARRRALLTATVPNPHGRRQILVRT